MNHRTTPHLLLTLTGIALVVTLAGCTSRIDPSLAGPTYVGGRQERVLDIQVVPGATTISFTNTTAESFGPSRIWINGWYSRRIDGLAVGQSLELALDSFRDEHGQSFRSGGFFAAERPEVVVLAQLQPERDGGEGPLLGLVVVAQP